MVAVERRFKLGSEQPRPLFTPGEQTPHKTGAQRIIEIKVHRWIWLRSMGYESQARAALADIRQYAEEHPYHAPRQRRAHQSVTTFK